MQVTSWRAWGHLHVPGDGPGILQDEARAPASRRPGLLPTPRTQLCTLDGDWLRGLLVPSFRPWFLKAGRGWGLPAETSLTPQGSAQSSAAPRENGASCDTVCEADGATPRQGTQGLLPSLSP